MTAQRRWVVRNERGVALILTLLITLAVAAMAVGGVMIASSGTLTARFTAKEAALHSLVDAGLEVARDSINRALTLLPDTGFITIAPASAIIDAQGNTVSGYTRTVYAGKTGGRTGGPATSGQYGSNYISIMSVINDPRGAVAARRGLFVQDSWSRFSVAINDWSNGSVQYGCGASFQGPFHSNDILRLQSGCTSPNMVSFLGPVTVVGSINNSGSGSYAAGYTTGAAPLAWPTPAQLGLMQQYAIDADVVNGDYDLTGGNTGTNRPCTRLDFQVLDSNQDGIIQWDEGYVRVFRCLNTAETSLAMVNGRRWGDLAALPADVDAVAGVSPTSDPNIASPNCGGVAGARPWMTALAVYNQMTALGRTATQKRDTLRVLLTSAQRRCLPGGDPLLRGMTAADTLLGDSASVNVGLPAGVGGRWVPRRLGAHPSVTTVRNTIAAGGDAEYWIPLGKNPNFKGVIFVNGDVAVSGRLRGRVSVVTTGNFVMQDDFQYWTPPGTDCSETGDIFGAIAFSNIVVQDNNMISPFRVNNVYWGGFDETPADESFDMFILTLNNYGGDIPGIPVYTGPSSPAIPAIAGESCGQAASGCLRFNGGQTLGRIDWWNYYQIGSTNSSGLTTRATYDRCGATNPPPYYPTTGRYGKSRYYELDPVWLNQTGIASYFRELQSR